MPTEKSHPNFHAEPLGIIFWLIALSIDLDTMLPCCLAALFHECGHLVAALILKVRLRRLSFSLYGFRLTVDSALLSYRNEAILAAAGPLFSFLLYPLTFLPQNSVTLDHLTTLRMATLSLGILNLLPVKRFDGGRILNALLSLFLPQSIAMRILDVLGALLLLFLWMISVYFLLCGGFGVSLFVFSFTMFCRTFL